VIEIMWICLFVALAMVFNAIMDKVHFLPGQGYWRIHQGDTRDGWHDSKKAMFFAFYLAIMMAYYADPPSSYITIIIFSILIYAFIIGVFHHFFYHLILKKRS
jgi:hypothetical protein